MKIGSGDSITSSAVDKGGILEVSGRADSSNITVRNDGLMILTEGRDSGSVIEEGGRQYIASNEAYAYDTQVSGEQWVSGGWVSETTIMNNGVTLLYSNATAARTTLKDNARMEVTRGVYQTGIRAKFTEDLSGHLSASYANGANIESPWRAAAGISWSF
ncbi:autotransporter outer membrane beta-barrel domain-containing protein [Citrobacter farmeri]|nr:autotransporter outer membrane beta-barrel domain-containing protein [Citrobacter farmeri]